MYFQTYKTTDKKVVVTVEGLSLWKLSILKAGLLALNKSNLKLANRNDADIVILTLKRTRCYGVL